MTTTVSEDSARSGYTQLETAFINEFLRGMGFTLEGLQDLKREQAQALLRAACLYASGRLAEVEARSHLVDELHGGHPAV
jgi:hypothetical protein